MGFRNGTWVKCYANVWFHENTQRLARSLEELGVPAEWSSDVAVGQLLRLAIGLADNGNGRIGHLAPRAFCDLIRWRGNQKKADAVLAAWLSSGFIDDPGTPDATLTGFLELFGQLLKKREAAKIRREEKRGTTRTPTGRHTDATRSHYRITQRDESESKTLSTENTPLPLFGSVGAAPAGAETVTAGLLASLWQELNPHLPQPRVPIRGEVAKALTAAAKRGDTLETWRERFQTVAASDWLSGRSGSFRASILWATGPKNVAKIDAGQYANHTNGARTVSRTETLYREAAELYERSRRAKPTDDTIPNELPA